MMIFLILAPYGAFATVMLWPSAAVSLFASAAICLMVIAYDMLRGRSIKILGGGSVGVCGGLGGYVALVDLSLSSSAVRLIVDAGVFAIALLSIAFRFPFTLQYAREMVDPETAKLPGFVKASYIITLAWTAALFAMMAANVLMIYSPGLPLWSGLAIAFAAGYTAVYFTKWYPEYHTAQYTVPPGPANALSGT